MFFSDIHLQYLLNIGYLGLYTIHTVWLYLWIHQDYNYPLHILYVSILPGEHIDRLSYLVFSCCLYTTFYWCSSTSIHNMVSLTSFHEVKSSFSSRASSFQIYINGLVVCKTVLHWTSSQAVQLLEFDWFWPDFQSRVIWKNIYKAMTTKSI